MDKKVENAFVGRTDGYVDTPKFFPDNIVQVWTHKKVVVPTKENPTEDDYVVEEKPVLLQEFNLDEQIKESAVGTSLPELIAQVVRTGDASILEACPGTYADITGFPQDSMEAKNAIIAGKAAAGDKFDLLGSLTKEELAAYIDELVKKQVEAQTGSNKEDAPIDQASEVIEEPKAEPAKEV